ncbi:hypothetical protein OG785_03485 [Streptomyces sp. NBC_00006]|uniref:hypothetical protein n=1 Tax=Streptomyces sp. NBC_00006 TaxID=2975619 RepID=UPI0022510C3C|nr:hypothetical protein [Streptomyces sp. NBC_00006]MCX5529631.1 hypothetical protein [Streptomyces sp. NBC_00006]
MPASQIRPLSPQLSLTSEVLGEPLPVALHAVHRAGDVRGKRVLVTGAGPIGCLVTAVLHTRGRGEDRRQPPARPAPAHRRRLRGHRHRTGGRDLAHDRPVASKVLLDLTGA